MIEVLLIGTGARAEAYMRHIEKGNLPIKIKAIAEIIEERRNYFGEKHQIPKERRKNSGEEALDEKEKYDAVIITTPDNTHYKLAIRALKKNYNVLLEKPMATNAKDCINLIKEQQRSGKILAICHVLRYAPFFTEIKKITLEQELGKLLNVDLIEDIGYWHFAHSYVRGNWRKESLASPIILAKSCHDLDILTWIVDSEANSVFSRGKRSYFNLKNKPKNSTKRCIDCPVLDCPFNAKRFYLNQGENPGWPFSAISQEDPSEKGREKALKETNYGKCVYQSDNDVCDNQDVIIEFKNEVNVNFALRFGGPVSTRRITLNYEKGQIIGDLNSGTIKKTIYTGRKDEIETKEIKFENKGGHGGGDPILLKEFIKIIQENDIERNITSAQRSLESHLIAFAAEKSRKSEDFEKLIKMDKFKKSITSR